MEPAKTAQGLDLIDVVILAGGAATRLGAAAKGRPKALLPVSGVPFMGLQAAEMARTARPRRVIACVRQGTATHFMEFAKGFEYPLVILEENEPLGTGGAILGVLSAALGQPGLSDPFIVANGDVLFRMDLARLKESAQEHGAAIAVINVPDAARFGAVDVETGRVKGFAEKKHAGPGLVSAGLYAFTHAALKSFPPGACSFEHDIAPSLARQGLLAAVAMNGPFIDIGTPATLAQADDFSGRFAS